jgi:hypothetical protein
MKWYTARVECVDFNDNTEMETWCRDREMRPYYYWQYNQRWVEIRTQDEQQVIMFTLRWV